MVAKSGDMTPVVDLTYGKRQWAGPLSAPRLRRFATTPAITPAQLARISRLGLISRKRENIARHGKRWCATIQCRQRMAGSAITPAKVLAIEVSSMRL